MYVSNFQQKLKYWSFFLSNPQISSMIDDQQIDLK